HRWYVKRNVGQKLEDRRVDVVGLGKHRLKVGQLFLRGQVVVQQQVGHFEERSVLSQFLDRVAPVGQPAFNGRDGRLAGNDSFETRKIALGAHQSVPTTTTRQPRRTLRGRVRRDSNRTGSRNPQRRRRATRRETQSSSVLAGEVKSALRLQAKRGVPAFG